LPQGLFELLKQRSEDLGLRRIAASQRISYGAAIAYVLEEWHAHGNPRPKKPHR